MTIWNIYERVAQIAYELERGKTTRTLAAVALRKLQFELAEEAKARRAST